MVVLGIAWGLGLGTACTGTDDGASYSLELVPVTAEKNQDPFFDVDTHTLQVQGSNNDVYQEMTLNGDQILLGGLDLLDGATISYRGSTNHQVTSFGRTGPISIVDGAEQSVPIWVGEVDAMGWLTERDSKLGVFKGALTALGDGRFLLFGGVDLTIGGGTDETFDTISLLDLGSPEEDPEFHEIGTMPTYTDGGSSKTARVGLTATTLNDVDELAGQVLVAGGSANWLDGTNVTGDAFFFDPETGDMEQLDSDAWLGEERHDHIAVQNYQGDVVLFGGWGKSALNGSPGPVSYVDYFDRSERKFQKLGPYEIGVYGAADILGTTEGVLHCGGIDVTLTSWYTLDSCYLAAPNEDVDKLSSELPIDLGHHTLTYLEEGKVLIAGGVSVGADILDFDDQLDASNRAWVYDHNERSFTEVNNLHIGRAGHAAVALTGGRVLVVGGVTSLSWVPFVPEYASPPIPCGEIFNLSDGSWTPADNCLAGDSSGALEGPAVWPMVANDPELGALVMGGATDNWSADVHVGYWTHRN